MCHQPLVNIVKTLQQKSDCHGFGRCVLLFVFNIDDAFRGGGIQFAGDIDPSVQPHGRNQVNDTRAADADGLCIANGCVAELPAADGNGIYRARLCAHAIAADVALQRRTRSARACRAKRGRPGLLARVCGRPAGTGVPLGAALSE